ncbi:hypothetical protein D3C72_1793250 [compost metagenome]
MAEGVHGLPGVRGKVLACDEDHPRRTEGDKPLPRIDHTHADGAGSIVATAPRNHHAALVRCAATPAPGQFRPKPGCSVAALHQLRHVRPCKAGGSQQLIRPIAPPNIQPQGAGGIRHVTHRIAAEQQPQPILGQ